jgi:hypothetical protein
MLPLLACDRVLFSALREVWRDPQLLDDLGTTFLAEDISEKSRALFDYLFVPTECSAIGTENRGVGFRLLESGRALVAHGQASLCNSGKAFR